MKTFKIMYSVDGGETRNADIEAAGPKEAVAELCARNPGEIKIYNPPVVDGMNISSLDNVTDNINTADDKIDGVTITQHYPDENRAESITWSYQSVNNDHKLTEEKIEENKIEEEAGEPATA